MSTWLALLVFVHFNPCDSGRTALNLSFTIGSGTSNYRRNHQMAIGYDASSDDILLFGGYYYKELFLLFKNHHFFTAGVDYLNYSIHGNGQYYTQFEDELFMMRPNAKGFLRVNTQTHESLTLYTSTPTNVSDGACLTSIKNHIIVIGGTSHMRVNATNPSSERIATSDGTSVQIYRLSDGEWLSDIPSLLRGRASLACAVVDGNIYAIGGEAIGNTHDQLDTIEVLDVSNMKKIASKSWYILRETLNTPREAARAVTYDTYIYVVGGYYYIDRQNQYYLRDINRINTVTEECIVVGYLAAGLRYTAPVIMNDVLYVFGGYSTEWYSNSHSFYQYASLSHNSEGTQSSDTKETMGRTAVVTIIIVCVCLIVILLILFFYFGKREFERAAISRQLTAGYDAKRSDAVKNSKRSDTAAVKKANTDQVIEVCEDKKVMDDITDGAIANVGADEFIIGSDSNSEHSAPGVRRTGTNILNEGEGQNVDVNSYVINPDSAQEVKTWLTSIGCSIYYDSFVNNGFDSLELIKEINNVNDLRCVGISMKAQQLKILNHIQKL